MFFLTEEDYFKNVRTKLFSKAWANLQNLISKREMFDRVHVVTFAQDASKLIQLVKDLPNVTLELPRGVQEWRYDGKPLSAPFVLPAKSTALSKIHLYQCQGRHVLTNGKIIMSRLRQAIY